MLPEVCKREDARGPPTLAARHPARPQSWGVRTRAPGNRELRQPSLATPARQGGKKEASSPAAPAPSPALCGPGSLSFGPRRPLSKERGRDDLQARSRALTAQRALPSSPRRPWRRPEPQLSEGLAPGEATARAGARNSRRGTRPGTGPAEPDPGSLWPRPTGILSPPPGAWENHSLTSGQWVLKAAEHGVTCSLLLGGRTDTPRRPPDRVPFPGGVSTAYSLEEVALPGVPGMGTRAGLTLPLLGGGQETQRALRLPLPLLPCVPCPQRGA